MSKPLSLLFAVASVVLMSATAIAVAHSAWLALLLFLLTLGVIASGFIVKARLRRRSNPSSGK